MTDKLCSFVVHLTHWLRHGSIPKLHRGGHLWCPRKLELSLRFRHTRVRLAQCAWEGHWTGFEPAPMILADSTAVARQVPTPIFAKSGTRKTACLDLPSGPQHLQGTGKHVVEPDLAQPVPYPLGTSRFTCRSGCANRAFWFTQSFWKSTQHMFFMFAQSLHTVYTPYPSV